MESKKSDDEEAKTGDLFAKSKKVRRAAQKAQREIEKNLKAEGNVGALEPKVPLHQQSIDLPSNERGTVKGAMVSKKAIKDVTVAMRQERRAKIKEGNFLKGVK